MIEKDILIGIGKRFYRKIPIPLLSSIYTILYLGVVAGVAIVALKIGPYINPRVHESDLKVQTSPLQKKSIYIDINSGHYKIDKYIVGAFGRYSNNYLIYSKQSNGQYTPLCILEAKERSLITKNPNGSFKHISDGEWNKLDDLIGKQERRRNNIEGFIYK